VEGVGDVYETIPIGKEDIWEYYKVDGRSAVDKSDEFYDRGMVLKE